ncbi:unnamed protein product, partial [Effrenium voratum]
VGASSWYDVLGCEHPQAPNRVDHERHVRRLVDFLGQVHHTPLAFQHQVVIRRRAFASAPSAPS